MAGFLSCLPDKIYKNLLVKNFKNIGLLLFLFACLHLLFAVLWFFRQSPYRLFFAAFFCIYAIVLFFLVNLLQKRKVLAKNLTLTSMVFSIFFSIFDQIGLIDLIYIATLISFLILLLKSSLNN